VITKHDGTGGMVTRDTVHQLAYEMGDPAAYITPDVVADFTSIRLIDEGPTASRVEGVRGRPETPTYKVSMSYQTAGRPSAS
jgi:hypothetical protein